MQHLLAQNSEHIFVAAVPVLEEQAKDVEGGSAAAIVADEMPGNLHHIATAARVLQMSRNIEVMRNASALWSSATMVGAPKSSARRASCRTIRGS